MRREWRDEVSVISEVAHSFNRGDTGEQNVMSTTIYNMAKSYRGKIGVDESY